MSCFQVILNRIRGKLKFTLTRIEQEVSLRINRIGGISSRCTREGGNLCIKVNRQGGIQCRMGLICRTNLGEDFVVLWSSEDMLMTIEGRYLVTRK